MNGNQFSLDITRNKLSQMLIVLIAWQHSEAHFAEAVVDSRCR